MPESWFLAEYLGVFTDVDESVFLYEQVMSALSAEIPPLFGVMGEPEQLVKENGVLPLFSEDL